MRPPRAFRVLGQRFSVGMVLDLCYEDEDGHDVGVLGLTDVDGQKVHLETKQGPDTQAETYLHEALHCMVAKAALHRDVLTDEKDEPVVKRLAPILLQFMRENPRVIEYLTGRAVGGKGSAG